MADTLVESQGNVFLRVGNPLPEPIPGNAITGSLWNLIVPDALNPVKSGRVFIGSISFEGYANASDRCMLRDAYDQIIFEAQGNSNLDPVEVHFSEPISVLDLRLVGLDSGRVVIGVV